MTSVFALLLLVVYYYFCLWCRFFWGVVGWEVGKLAVLYYVVPTGRLSLQQLHCHVSHCSGSLHCVQPIFLAVSLAVEQVRGVQYFQQALTLEGLTRTMSNCLSISFMMSYLASSLIVPFVWWCLVMLQKIHWGWVKSSSFPMRPCIQVSIVKWVGKEGRQNSCGFLID